jgi:uncharacterized protein
MRTMRIARTLLITLLITLLALLALPVVRAEDARPTEQSIRELLAVMQAHNMVDTMMAQMDANFASTLKQAMGEQQLSEREQQITDDAHAKIRALLREQLQWASFEPMMVRVYQNTFSQKDIDGMKAFYSSPTGQAVIAKMPLAVQQTMQSMQQRTAGLIPQIKQIQKDMLAQLKEARGTESAPAAQESASPSPTPQ